MAGPFDLKDVMLEASAELQQLIREVVAELSLPTTKAKIEQSWATAPSEMKDQFINQRPEEHKALESMMKGDN